MTRTERNLSPAALLKDRSLSRSGYDKHMHKNGAGGHNWGSYVEEAKQQQHGIDRSEEVRDDDDDEEQEDGQEDDGAGPAITKDDTTTGAASQVSDDGNNGVSSSARKPGPPRRASSGMTAEERERARQWRHGVMQREVDLTAIARTSGAVSHSPTSPATELPGNMSALATSPSKTTVL